MARRVNSILAKKTAFVFSALFLLALIISPSIAIEAPKISGYLTDNAGVFDGKTAGEVESALRALEQKTAGVQFVIFIDRKMPEGTTIEEYSLALAEANGLGKKGKDNGLLFYVSIEDREYRWETGYGLEAALSAPLLGRVSRDYIVPRFSEGNYAGGILAGASIVEGILLNSTDPDVLRVREEAGSDYSEWETVDAIVISIFFILLGLMLVSFVASLFSPKSKDNDTALIAASLLFSRGWGFGGRGGGGFGGGGGGFGGGGFSGKW